MVRMHVRMLADSNFYVTFSGLRGHLHRSCGSQAWLPREAADQYVTNMLGGARPGPRAISYASCVRTLPSLPK